MILWKYFKWYLLFFVAASLYLQDTACFFVKDSFSRCLAWREMFRHNHTWGKLWDVLRLPSYNCLAPGSQFRFDHNGVMYSVEYNGCLAAYKILSDVNNIFYIYVPTPGQEASACGLKENRAITQTPQGFFQIEGRDSDSDPLEKRCVYDIAGYNVVLKCNATPKTPFLSFYFGSVTCFGDTVTNASCPPSQTMVITSGTAAYRRLTAGKTCGSEEDPKPLQVGADFLVKTLCDGEQSCTFPVDEKIFPGNPWTGSGYSKYLYFEYKCVDTPQPFQNAAATSVSLSQGTVPNEGYVQVTIRNKANSVCYQSLKKKAKKFICKLLGYSRAQSVVGKPKASFSIVPVFPGSLTCYGSEIFLFQCPTTHSTRACSELSYLNCHICEEPLLADKKKFPDPSFTSSTSNDPNAMNARISSGSSWCATSSDGNQYLQVNLGRLYVVNTVATFGDSKADNWVTSYNVRYFSASNRWVDASSSEGVEFQGNTKAGNHASIKSVQITAFALRFIPLGFNGKPCMRVEICGPTLLPDEPRDLTVTPESRSALLTWKDPVNVGDTNLKRFRLEVWNESSLVLNITKLKDNVYSLAKLNPFTKYRVSVAVGNTHGFGGKITREFTTLEAAPDAPPRSITFSEKTSSSLSVKWLPPEKDKRNGVIVNYTVCISLSTNDRCRQEETTEDRKFKFRRLSALTRYYVSVLASTKAGNSTYSESQAETTNAEPPGKGKKVTSKTLTYDLTRPLNFTKMYVVAMKLSDVEPKPSSQYKNSELVTYDVALNFATPRPYIAAVIRASGFEQEFVLGDGRNTTAARQKRSTAKSYNNGPLQPKTKYQIFQRVFDDQNVYYSTDWSPFAQTLAVEPETPGGSDGGSVGGGGGGGSVGAIVGAIAGVLVLLVLVVFAFLLYKRRAGMRSPKPADENHEILDSGAVFNKSYNDSGTSFDGHKNDVRNDYEEPQIDNKNEKVYTNVQEDIYANQETVVARSHNPIPVAEFSDYVDSMRLEDDKEFKLEFEDLPQARAYNWDVAKRPYNAAKNRYANAVTYNHSRVVLSGDEKDDYINASYIDGIRENYYIATQGPKPKTVNDFWRMVFEQNCPTIVMLTTLKEMGKVKCEKYWPDGSDKYGDIKVTAVKCREFADYVIRTFLLQKGGKRLDVTQFHFISWPDYGVPTYPTQILTFRRHYKSHHENNSGPAVIHCSAGVGRTGVFIALDKIIDDLDLKRKTTIDIFGFVKDMRSRRVNMVQTPDQYVFIHVAIVDHIKCGTNEVEATQVRFEIKKLSEKYTKRETGFEAKFKRLNSVSPKLAGEQCEAALLEENRKKNRRADVYPSESNRVYLKHMEDVENSDYINACYVDGYLGKNYFIATQTPLSSTIGDFWRMIVQHKSSTIVVLHQLREQKEEYPIFWPTQRAKPQAFGPITVMMDSFSKNDNIVLRKFIVSPSPDLKDGRLVRMVHYMSWPDHGVPANVDDFVQLLGEVEESQRSADTKGPVTVVCSDGAGRTGTYIAISNLVDRVKVVQVIDVFQTIKLIRGWCPQFVETAEQFKLCYDAVACVLESFDEYSNFSLNDN